MAVFRYRAIAPTGEILQGTLEVSKSYMRVLPRRSR